MTGNVNFLTQNVGSETSLLDKNVEIDRKITFLCPFCYIFKASVHFKVGRSSSRLCLVEKTMTGNVNFMTQNVGPWTSFKQFIWGY